MIGWLEKQKPAPKVAVAPKEKEVAAWVEPTFGPGAAVLQRGDRLVRVVWPLAGGDQRRVLPPGKYTIHDLRIERKQGGSHWFIATSGKPYPKLVVAKKGRTKLAVSNELVGVADAQFQKDKLVIKFVMTAKSGRGVTLFKDAKRVSATYRVLDAAGKELAKGKLEFG